VAAPVACVVAPHRWQRQSRAGASARLSLEVRKQKRTSPQRWALTADKGGDAVDMATQVGGDGMMARSDRGGTGRIAW
jgi:hypothetical protein